MSGVNDLPGLQDKEAIEVLAEFRHQIRRFERISENIARKAGLTGLQYQLLLQIKGYPGREWATLTELADRLQARHNSVVALVNRCEERGLVVRQADPEDRRQVYVRLLPKGSQYVEKLARMHADVLASMSRQFKVPHL